MRTEGSEKVRMKDYTEDQTEDQIEDQTEGHTEEQIKEGKVRKNGNS